MQKFGGILILRKDLFEGADAESWWDLEPHNFPQGFFFRELADTESWRDLEPHNFPQGFFLRELMQKVGGIWSPIIFRKGSF